MTYNLYRRGAYWADRKGNLYAWDEDEQTFINVETGEIAVPLMVVSEDEVMVG